MFAPGIGFDHVGERGHHLFDLPHGLAVRLRHGVFDAAELAVQDLAPEQVLELLERLRGGLAAPLIVGELPDRRGGVAGDRVEFGLAQPCLVARVGKELSSLLPDGLVE